MFVSNNLFLLGLPIPQLDPFTDIAGQAAVVLGEGSATSPPQVQSIMNTKSFTFGTKNGFDQIFSTTTGCGVSPPPPPPAPTTPTPPTDSPPPPSPTPAGCSSYNQKSLCQENGCVWNGHPDPSRGGYCGDGGTPPTDSPPPPSPGGCTTCSGLGGGACKSCPNCSWGGKQGCLG